MKLNYGCGEVKFEGYVNIDIEPSVEPDLICDLRKNPFEYESESVEEIICSHNIEHIEGRYWPQIFTEFHRVLKPSGNLILLYPEWKVCAQNYLSNYLGMKDYWKATLYGRQLYPGDYHITIVDSLELQEMLKGYGFYNIIIKDDPEGPHYKVLFCQRGEKAKTSEDVMREQVFG